MIRRSILAALLVVAAGCTHDYDQDEKTRSVDLATQADQYLAQSDLQKARESYYAALRFDPANAHASLGAAVVDLLLLPDAQPVNEFFDACGQPHFNVQEQIFGASGVLALDEQVRQGSGSVQVLYQNASQGAFRDLGFAPEHFRAFLDEEERTLTIRLSDAQVSTTGKPGTVDVVLGVDDVYPGDAVATPLVDGLAVDLSRVPYALSVWLDSTWSNGAAQGTVVFHGGTRLGASFSLELQGVQIGACELVDAIPLTACDSSRLYSISGTINDVVSKRFDFDPNKMPFGTVSVGVDDLYASSVVMAVERCGSALTTDLVAEKAWALLPYLDTVSANLTDALAEGPEDVGFVLPKSLLHTDFDVPLNGTDVLALRSATRLSSALLGLFASYRYLDGPLANLIGEFTGCKYTQGWCDNQGCHDSLVTGLVRDFIGSRLAPNLNATFLVRAAGFDLGGVQGELKAALEDAIRALRNAPAQQGILNFQEAHSRVFSNQLAEQLQVIRDSFDSGAPLAFARNPLYRVHVKAFFDNPLDRDRLRALSNVSELFRYVPADPGSLSCSAYNGYVELQLPEGDEGVERWTGGVVSLPPPLSATCSDTVACPAGYECQIEVPLPGAPIEGVCEAQRLWFVEEGPLEQVFESDWPAFLSPDVRRIVDSWD